MNKTIRRQAQQLYDAIGVLRQHICQRVTESMANCGTNHPELTIPQMHTVMAVRGAGQMTIKAVAETMRVSPPSASSMVDRLVELGVLLREHSTEDRRAVIVRVSTDGEEAVGHLEHAMLTSIAELLEFVGPEDASKWCDIYERISGKLTSGAQATEK